MHLKCYFLYCWYVDFDNRFRLDCYICCNISEITDRATINGVFWEFIFKDNIGSPTATTATIRFVRITAIVLGFLPHRVIQTLYRDKSNVNRDLRHNGDQYKIGNVLTTYDLKRFKPEDIESLVESGAINLE